jgi:outer membrane protein OmpA-like peptidoglycan-associated protein
VVVLVSMACAGSPPSRTPEPRASSKPSRAPAASPPSPAPEDSWAKEEDEQDRDRDQIADSRDHCPDEAERYNGFKDNDGCPDKDNFSRGEEQIIATFDEQKADRDPNDLRLFVDEIVRFLAENQNITLLEVSGHAEASEERGPRKQLSQRRADFVKRLLLDQGVDKTRVVSRGYGSDCPLQPPTEHESVRRLNRRVSYRVLETTSGPQEVTPCPN